MRFLEAPLDATLERSPFPFSALTETFITNGLCYDQRKGDTKHGSCKAP